MKKLLQLLIILGLTIQTASAESINKVIFQSGINKSAVAISIKDVSTGKVIYELNSKKPMMPASTLKIITYTSALNELGDNYEFSTELYKNTNNELILKLGADPFLKSSNLKYLMKVAKEKNIVEPKAFKIDDSILDNTEWGEGWQWDDDLNPLMPKFSAYNIDNNLLHVEIEPTSLNAPANVKLTTFYPTTFLNLVKTEKSATPVKLSRNNNIAPDLLTLEGSVNATVGVSFPVNYPKRYFILRLEDAIRSAKVSYYNGFTHDRLKHKNEYLVAKITNPISEATKEVMLNSNNMVAETVFKIAGGHYAKQTGSASNGVEMVKHYCDKIGVNYDDIKIVDGSGVSKNNLITADFMTTFLSSQDKTQTMLAKPGEGTLAQRMLYFSDKLKAKTGTLSDVSAIAGYITTTSGKTYAFDIMINDPKSKDSEKKMLEEYLLRTIQVNY